MSTGPRARLVPRGTGPRLNEPGGVPCPFAVRGFRLWLGVPGGNSGPDDMDRTLDQFTAGQTVRITQQIPRQRGAWTSTTVGIVVGYERRETGSWFAHARHDRLWLDRLVLKKDDGEIVFCNLDAYSRVELLAEAAPVNATPVGGSPA